MKINFNPNVSYNISMKASSSKKQNVSSKTDKTIKQFLEPFSMNKKAKIPPLTLTSGINPNNNDVFDTFTKLDNVTRDINFVKSQSAWDDCLLEEIEEFNVARSEFELNPTIQNYDHMEEEMGDIFYTAASIAKDSGINPKEAFKATNRKFYNRINIMERLCVSADVKTPNSLKDCKDYERRALWNAAKRKLYDAQMLQYESNTSDS